MPRSSKKPPRLATRSLPVVGIGASAGGLEALQEFFGAVPDNPGLAFVVVQHLSPDYRSLMDELLARHTSMRIVVVEDGLPVEANTVYLIPPRRDLSVRQGRLVLQELTLRRGVHLPVDVFFMSLAAEYGKNAIGIVLSGTGSDGTLGARAIKEAGGLVMAQDEQTAKFDGMPRSAIATGLVDFVLPPAQMPEALVGYLRHPFVQTGLPLGSKPGRHAEPLAQVHRVLRDHSGLDFSFYKESTVVRRVERRVSINRFGTLDEYLAFLRESDKEKDTLFREMLIGVTRFFRDQESFASLERNVLPLLATRPSLRIWSAGCSTGEEVYSLAILVLDYAARHNLDVELKIFATDVDPYALETAGRGFYPDSIAADVDPVLLGRYFERRDRGWQISDAVRRVVVFARHNLLKDPPFSRLDLLVCRNLFIYFRPEVQVRLLGVFFHCLAPDGFLFLGPSETLGELSDAFATVDSKWKLYRQRRGYEPAPEKSLPLMAGPSERQAPLGLRLKEPNRLDRLSGQLLALVLPPSVVVDAGDQIVQTVGDTSRFLRIQPGRFSPLLFDHLPSDLGLLVSTVLRRLRQGEARVALDHLVGLADFPGLAVSLEGRLVADDGSVHFLVSFVTHEAQVEPPVAEVPAMSQLVLGRVAELENELRFTRNSLQAAVEELETSNEELQSSNEELIASNEELQSTNEELQSVNEELYTVNSEFQNKIEELTSLSNDEANLLRNTEVGALYLDRDLRIRRLTAKINSITRVLPTDVGRPLDHLSVLPTYPEFAAEMADSLETLAAHEREVRGLDGQPYLVTIRPYRTELNVVNGVMATFVDVSSLHRVRDRFDQAYLRLENALELGDLAWWEWDYRTGKVEFDPRKATMLGYQVEEFPDTMEGICHLLHPEDYERTMAAMRDHLRGLTPTWDCTYRIRRRDGGWATYHDRGAIRTRDAEGRPSMLVGTVRKVEVAP